VTNLNGFKACARLVILTLAAFGASGIANAADLRPGPGAPPSFAYGYAGFFYPTWDPRCRIVPMPEASLYGETARMRPTAVCQSQGLYGDSVLFP
jgi:hypothetical protein